ncbi:MAG: DUF4595 domain-containing protein [Bacteroidales bacterium]|nr:DUF4595 domain-containing protein [Bacteroidales bacterium]
MSQWMMAAGMALLMSACSGGGSDEPYVEPEPYVPPVLKLNTPNYMGGSLVRQIRYMGAFDKVWRWAFTYQDKQLVEAVSWKLTDGLTTVSEADAAQYSFTYEPEGIVVTSAGTAAPVLLNIKDKLLSSARSGNTTYSYAYSNDGRLLSWEVIYQNTGFNAETTKGAAGTLTWDSNGNIAEIVYTPSMDAPTKKYTYSFTYADAFNMNGLLPELSSLAMGCEGSEYLYYMGLMGKSTRNLPSHLTISYSETPETPQAYSFHYFPVNGKDVTRCEYGEIGHVVTVEYNY